MALWHIKFLLSSEFWRVQLFPCICIWHAHYWHSLEMHGSSRAWAYLTCCWFISQEKLSAQLLFLFRLGTSARLYRCLLRIPIFIVHFLPCLLWCSAVLTNTGGSTLPPPSLCCRFTYSQPLLTLPLCLLPSMSGQLSMAAPITLVPILPSLQV